MATNLAPFIRQRYFDSNGDPLAGGKLYSYQAGTSTPQATYTDSGAGTPNANPVILDADGEADVWLDTSLSYKFVLKDSSDVTQWTVDNIIGLATIDSIATASIIDLAVTTAKLADDSVTAAKLADDASIDANRAVTTNHVRDAAITRAKLAAGAIGSGNVVSKSNSDSPYTVLTTDDIILCSSSGGALTNNLPTAAGINGRKYTFIKTDSGITNSVTLNPSGSETIGGASTYALDLIHESVTIISDNANWKIYSRFIPKVAAIADNVGASYTGANPIIAGTESLDTHGAYNTATGEFTAPKAGVCRVAAFLDVNVSSDAIISAYVAGVAQNPRMGIVLNGSDQGGGAGLVNVTKGQIVTIRASQNWSAVGTNSGLSFEMF